jgi:hypothetical protein
MAFYDSTAQINTTTIDNYLRIKVEPIFKLSYLLNELKARGQILHNQHGKTTVWFPRFRRRTITPGSGNPVNIAFPNVNVRKEVSLPWRHYQLGESIPYISILQNQNRETAIFSIVQDTIDGGAEDFMEDFRRKVFFDGNAGTGKDIHGLESIFSVNGLVTDSMVGDPNDSYAGLSTALGVSGSWTPDSDDGWPTGSGATEYHWWSPLVVDYQNSGWTGTVKDWTTTWQQVLNYALMYQGILQKKEVDVVLLNPELFRQAKDSLQSTQRFILSERSKPTDVGFKRLSYEDVEFATEYSVPDGVGYLLNLNEIELRCMTAQLVETQQDTDITSGGQRLFSFQFYGNMLIKAPSFQAKLQPISALGT